MSAAGLVSVRMPKRFAAAAVTPPMQNALSCCNSFAANEATGMTQEFVDGLRSLSANSTMEEITAQVDSVNTMRALEDGIENFAGTVFVISHDRWFLDRIATHILAFEGDSSVLFFDGNYTEYEEDRKKRLGKDADQPHRIKFRKLTR